MTIDLKTLKVGDSVRFTNGQVAKVDNITENNAVSVRLYFDKEVACDTDDYSVVSNNWYYKIKTGECSGRTNHIIEITKKGEKTMNKHKIEKSLEWHKRKIAELEEALKEPERKRWFPKKNEQYYGIGSRFVETYNNINEECTKDMYSTNNIFKTSEEAEKELARRKAETELLDMCDWTSDCDRMYVISYDKSISNFSVDYCWVRQYTPYLFTSGESARKAIDTLGEDKLKLIFRI